METDIDLRFFCGLCGYTNYNAVWCTRNHELLVSKQELNNSYHQYANREFQITVYDES